MKENELNNNNNPCNLSREELERNHLLEKGICIASYADGSVDEKGNFLTCNKPLGAHPREQQLQLQQGNYIF